MPPSHASSHCRPRRRAARRRRLPPQPLLLQTWLSWRSAGRSRPSPSMWSQASRCRCDGAAACGAKPHMLLSKPPVAAAQHCPSLNAVFLCTGPPQGIKRKLEAATSVSEKRMKLLGLKVQAGGAARGWQGPCRAVGRLAKCVWCSHAWCAECTCYCRSLLHHHCMCTCLLPTDLPSAHCLRAQVRSGKPAGDADLVADLLLKPGAKIMMMGCVAAGAA